MSQDSFWKIVWRYNNAEHETFCEASGLEEALKKFNSQEKMPSDVFIIEVCLCEVLR